MQEKIILHCMVTTDGQLLKLSALSMTKAKVGAEDVTVEKASKRKVFNDCFELSSPNVF